MKTSIMLSAIAFALAFLAARQAASQAAPNVTVAIIPESDTVKQYEPFYVTVLLTNQGREDVTVSLPRGPVVSGPGKRRSGEMARPQVSVRTVGGLRGFDWEPLPAASHLHLDLDVVETWVLSTPGEYRMRVGATVSTLPDARGQRKHLGGMHSEWVHVTVVPDAQNARALDGAYEAWVRGGPWSGGSWNPLWSHYQGVVYSRQDPGSGRSVEIQSRRSGSRLPQMDAADKIFEANLSSRLRAKAAMSLAFEQVALGKQKGIEPGVRDAHFAKAIDLMRSTEDPAWKAPPTGGIVARHWAGLLVLYAETGNRPEAEEMLQRLEQRFPKYVEHRPALREWARK